VKRYRRVALVGTGLIGGSLAAALKAAGGAERIVGADARPDAAEQARARGLVDEVAPIAAAADGADLVVIAVPVRATLAVCEALAPVVAPAALVTDVGSTKRGVLEAVARALPFPERFVGAHPIAGTERSGPDAADAKLFQGRRCLLTPTAATRAESVEECAELWRAAGALVETIDPERHDRLLAFVSHLPHAAAFALAAAVADEPGAAGLQGGGFVDTTRIAASDAAMWRDIFLQNRDALADALERLDGELGALRRAVAAGDGAAVEEWIERARRGRAQVLAGRPA
jgi:prephenate dehydrogenase